MRCVCVWNKFGSLEFVWIVLSVSILFLFWEFMNFILLFLPHQKVLIDNNNIYFGDDVGSKGHHSQNIGEVDAISAMVQFKGPKGKGPCWPSNVPFAKWF